MADKPNKRRKLEGIEAHGVGRCRILCVVLYKDVQLHCSRHSTHSLTKANI